MNKVMVMLIGLIVVTAIGCGTVPTSPIRSGNLDGEHLVYFEQSDRVPKDVVIEAIKSQAATLPMANAQIALSPEIIAEIVKEIVAVMPEFSKTYANERMNETLVGRRILIRGYYGTNELAEINNIVKSMNGCIEKWSQPNKTK